MTRPAQSDKGIIYFVECGANGPIKIGFTARNVQSRLYMFNSASPYDVRLLGVHDGICADETALHKRFEQYRIKSEWYIRNNEILKYITESCPIMVAGVFKTRKSHRMRETGLSIEQVLGQ